MKFNGLWGREFDCIRLYMSGIALGIPYGTKLWQEKNLRKYKKINLAEIKFGENVKILIIVVELQKAWQIKFGDLVKIVKLFSHQTFVLYIVYW